LNLITLTVSHLAQALRASKAGLIMVPWTKSQRLRELKKTFKDWLRNTQGILTCYHKNRLNKWSIDEENTEKGLIAWSASRF